MKYKGIYIKISHDREVHRVDKNGEPIICEGFLIQLFADEDEKIEIDNFTAAMDFEVLSLDLEEAVQFAKDVIDAMEKTAQSLI